MCSVQHPNRYASLNPLFKARTPEPKKVKCLIQVHTDRRAKSASLMRLLPLLHQEALSPLGPCTQEVSGAEGKLGGVLRLHK